MVSEAEKYKAEDDANRNRIEAKNGLENYCYSLKSSVGGEEFASKLSADDKSKLDSKIDETIAWLDSNPAAEKEEYEEKRKALEEVALPILQSAAGGMPGAGGMPDMGGMPGAGAPPADDPASGPTIEEID
jgi:L1 cell adhesion molecule like protein